MALVKNIHQKFQEHGFSVYRRYLCLHNYPEPKNGKHLKVGEIKEFKNEDICVGEYDFINTPLFRLLDWYEHRTFEQLFTVKHIQISNYEEYWRVGDILDVEAFALDSKTLYPKFMGFYVGGHKVSPENCIPLMRYEPHKYRQLKTIKVEA